MRTWDCVGWRRGGCNICLTLMPVRRAVDDTCEALLPCVQTIRRVNGEDKSRVREEILARNGGAKVAASFRSPTRLSIHTATALLSAAPPDAYLRARDLAKLPLWPHEIQVLNAGEHARLLARMRRALRLERQRGIAGHWAYDLARHAQLLRAYRAETADYLQRIGERRTRWMPKD